MDCIRFWTVIFGCGFILFLSLFLILKYQIEFYRYPVKNQTNSETTALVSACVYLALTIGFIIWGKRKAEKHKLEIQQQYSNLPANQFEAAPEIENEKKMES
ncbi:unnamed protein product [Paramecium primaurelia]|uniref:Uncharacterized protein n=1 Tax=Paramecium primaurelia TaxID=5886 RepID=A0A8S1P866_PARPR|nr:unnamed protein product [Paramecium primaurelia]